VRQRDCNVQRYVSISLSEPRTAIAAHSNFALDYQRTCTLTAITAVEAGRSDFAPPPCRQPKPAPDAAFRATPLRPAASATNSTSLDRAQTSSDSGCLERGSEMLRMAEFRSARIVTTLALLLGISLFSVCAGLPGSGSNSPTSAVETSPATANVRAGETLQFTAKVNGTMAGTMNPSFVWSVNGVVGGNATFGTISTSGLYTPAALPTPNSVSIEASSASDKTLSGKTEVALENPIPTATAISPTAVPVGNFSITITGTNFVSGAKVTFAGETLTTKFVSAELTATGTTSAAQQNTSVQLMVAKPGSRCRVVDRSDGQGGSSDQRSRYAGKAGTCFRDRPCN
jgi:IPT/TIG domain-containing protein